MYTVCVLYVYIKSWVSNYHPSWIWLEMNDLPHIIIYRDSHNSLVFFFVGRLGKASNNKPSVAISGT
jgi:hypothetical protein